MIRPISQSLIQNISNPGQAQINQLNNTIQNLGQINRNNRLMQMQEQQQALQRRIQTAPIAKQFVDQAMQLGTPEERQEFFIRNKDTISQLGFYDYSDISLNDFTDETLSQVSNRLGSMGQQGQGGGIGKYNPGDYTVKTWSEFLQSGDPSVLKRYESSVKERLAGDSELAEKVQTVETNAAASKARATEQAKADVQLKMKPMIQKAIKQAESEAKAKGESLTDLQRAEAALPGLKEVVGRLNVLSDAATYTMAGKAFDFMAKELGFGATKGATARARMESLVNNQVLPLLKQTFGAAFTEKEGEKLSRTLIDLDAPPEARKAALQSFIDQKMRDIDTKKREAGIEPEQTQQAADPLGIR